MKEITAKLYLKDNAKPKFMKARPVPYALQGRVHKELTRLETLGIIKNVSHSDWASPIVPVVKDDNTVRICGDFKQTVNPQLHREQYPMQRIEDMFSTLSGGKKFVLQRLLKFGLCIKLKKCVFFSDSVKYLGHVIDRDGLRTSDDKVNDIVNAPAPENVTELRSFLGLINYMANF